MSGITYIDENDWSKGQPVKLNGNPPFPAIKIGRCFMLLAYCDVDPGPGTRHEGMFIIGPKKERAKLIEEWDRFTTNHDDEDETWDLLKRFKDAQNLIIEIRRKANGPNT